MRWFGKKTVKNRFEKEGVFTQLLEKNPARKKVGMTSGISSQVFKSTFIQCFSSWGTGYFPAYDVWKCLGEF